ncbi:MAG: hypothetical protein WA705_08390 [Candidatus Ozemobacteraceae bacterium]
MMTKQGSPDGTTGAIEDQVEFPPKGFRTIVFLKKAQDGSWETVNTVQGIWPLKDGKPIGMGYGVSLEKLKNLILAK